MVWPLAEIPRACGVFFAPRTGFRRGLERGPSVRPGAPLLAKPLRLGELTPPLRPAPPPL